ncbi:MAG: tetratricopeptide repeat protein [Candidatus Magnetominusculus sp. LBB02]|nr:tetratricopeptide repeat protein [Candidatus Magnetominusculus sp. LBB02]
MLKEYLSSQYYRTSQYSYNSNKEIGMVMQSLNIYPGNFIARCKLGEIYALKRDYNAAVREYRLAMNTNPQYADTYFEIAKILPQNDAIIEVEKGLQLANNYTEESVNTIQTVSSILMRQGKAEDAISMLKNVYKLNQGYYEVDINIGNNLAQLGRYYEAIKHYNYVLRVSQQYSGNAYLGLGNVYNKIDNYLEAIRYYQLALSNEKDAKSMICFLARFNLGNILLDYNHIDEAIEQFNYLLNINRQMTVEYFVKYGVSEKIYEKTGRRLEWQYMHMYNNNTIDLTGAIR